MLKVTVCIGSSCHIKGSRFVVEKLQQLIAENNLGDEVKIGGAFCMGKCQSGVSVAIGEEVFSVSPDTVNAFFEENILSVVNSKKEI
jgi:NADH:ubiquinone oxidoreductase subunit E